MSERSNASFVSPISSMSPLQKAINDKFRKGIHHTWSELSPLLNAERVHTSYAPPGREKVSVLNAFSNNAEIAPRLRAMGARSMRSAYKLRRAIYNRNVEKARRIINEEYPDLTYTGTSGISTLSQAIQYTPDIVIDLIRAGADINTPNIDGTTPLIRALRSGIADIYVLELIDKGADVNAVDLDGTTALMIATANKKDIVVLALIAKGATIVESIRIAASKGDTISNTFNTELISILSKHNKTDIINRLEEEIRTLTNETPASKSTNGGSKKRRSHRRRKTRKPRKY